VLCSAGKRGWDVAVHPQDLIRLTPRGDRGYPRVIRWPDVP
jgi:hypothetical protein